MANESQSRFYLREIAQWKQRIHGAARHGREGIDCCYFLSFATRESAKEMDAREARSLRRRIGYTGHEELVARRFLVLYKDLSNLKVKISEAS